MYCCSVIGASEKRREASGLPQAFIAKWLPVISETTFHFKAPDVVVFLFLLFICGVVSHGGGQWAGLICFLFLFPYKIKVPSN